MAKKQNNTVSTRSGDKNSPQQKDAGKKIIKKTRGSVKDGSQNQPKQKQQSKVSEEERAKRKAMAIQKMRHAREMKAKKANKGKAPNIDSSIQKSDVQRVKDCSKDKEQGQIRFSQNQESQNQQNSGNQPQHPKQKEGNENIEQNRESEKGQSEKNNESGQDHQSAKNESRESPNQKSQDSPADSEPKKRRGRPKKVKNAQDEVVQKQGTEPKPSSAEKTIQNLKEEKKVCQSPIQEEQAVGQGPQSSNKEQDKKPSISDEQLERDQILQETYKVQESKGEALGNQKITSQKKNSSGLAIQQADIEKEDKSEVPKQKGKWSLDEQSSKSILSVPLDFENAKFNFIIYSEERPKAIEIEGRATNKKTLYTKENLEKNRSEKSEAAERVFKKLWVVKPKSGSASDQITVEECKGDLTLKDRVESQELSVKEVTKWGVSSTYSPLEQILEEEGEEEAKVSCIEFRSESKFAKTDSKRALNWFKQAMAEDEIELSYLQQVYEMMKKKFERLPTASDILAE